MRLTNLCVGLILNVALVLPVRATERALDLLDVAVSYSADFTVESDQGRYNGKVWHMPGREKRQFVTRDGEQALLLRRDTDSAYLLKPGGKWYVGLGLSAVGSLAGGIDQLTVERTRLGQGSVAGLAAIHYRVKALGPKSSRFDGEAWFSAKEGILLRAKGVLRDARGGENEVETTLSNVRLTALDESVFEPPQGWFGMDLRSVPAERIAQVLETMRPMLQGRGTHQ